MRPILLVLALAPASAMAQEAADLGARYRVARGVGIGSGAALGGGALLSGTLMVGGMDEDEALMPFGIALLAGGPVMTWSANRGQRLATQMGYDVGGFWADLSTVSSVVLGLGMMGMGAEIGDEDVAVALAWVGILGSYGFGTAQWIATENARATQLDPLDVPDGSERGRQLPPLTFATRW